MIKKKLINILSKTLKIKKINLNQKDKLQNLKNSQKMI